MSYDLTFWKQESTCDLSPARIYRELVDGREVDGLEVIPTTAILARVHQEFPGITEAGNLIFWEGGARGMFEIYSSRQHVYFCCRQMSESDMNRLVDIASEFQCALYDPQVDTRYGGVET